MRIASNIAAINAQRNLEKSSGQIKTSMERLTTGLRINSAKDDAAGLAISNRLTSQIRGITQVNRNANDAISLMQVADGALNSIETNMMRVRELSIQAGAGSLSETDKKSLQSEVNQLITEITRVANETKFNGVTLFSGTGGSLLSAEQEAVVDGLRNSWLENSEDLIQQYYGLTGDGSNLEIVLQDDEQPYAAAVGFDGYDSEGKIYNLKFYVDMNDFTPATLPNGVNGSAFYNDRIVAHEMVHATMGRSINMASSPLWFIEGTAEFIHGADVRVASDLALAGGGVGGANTVVDSLNSAWSGSSRQYSAGYVATRYLHDRIKTNGGEGIKDVMTYMSQNSGATFDDALANVASSVEFTNNTDFLTIFTAAGGAGSTYLQNMNLSNDDTGAIGGFDADGGVVRDAESVIPDTLNYTKNPLEGFTEVWSTATDTLSSSASQEFSFHVGVNRDESVSIEFGGASAVALDINDIDLLDNYNRGIVKIDNALEHIDQVRANLGAFHSRLESVLRVQADTQINLVESRSRILDADFAKETTTLARSQILTQAASSMLVQANSSNDLVLRLLQ